MKHHGSEFNTLARRDTGWSGRILERRVRHEARTSIRLGVETLQQQLWLTAAGLPASIATRRGMTFDQGFMAIQAAMEGLGVAMGRFHLVEADIAAGRLVAPFDMVLPRDAGYYVVSPEATADAPKIARLRDWLIASATPGALAVGAG
jgi:DNA-binding transcriptional LysR family regulator